MEKSEDNKLIKKIVVNTLTCSRIAGSILMPILFTHLSSGMFIILIASLLFTDLLDGFLAKKCWHVSTIFGSIADMTADKLLGISILVILTGMYPIMAIPLLLEMVIAGANIKSALDGKIVASSELGRLKTVIMGISMCVLLLTGMSPELVQSLNNFKGIDINNSILNNLGEFGEKICNLFNGLSVNLKDLLKNVEVNKDIINTAAEIVAITSESFVAYDYMIKSIKSPDKNSKIYKLADLKQNRKFIKQILFDEKYAELTKNMPMIERLLPEEYKDEIKRKRLVPDKN